MLDKGIISVVLTNRDIADVIEVQGEYMLALRKKGKSGAIVRGMQIVGEVPLIPCEKYDELLRHKTNSELDVMAYCGEDGLTHFRIESENKKEEEEKFNMAIATFHGNEKPYKWALGDIEAKVGDYAIANTVQGEQIVKIASIVAVNKDEIRGLSSIEAIITSTTLKKLSKLLD